MFVKVWAAHLKKFKGLRIFLGLNNLFRFRIDFKRFIYLAKEFQSKGGVIDSISIYIDEWSATAGTHHGQYFWQDLYVAQRIFELAPKTLLDVGSRLDGFVTHVATFRKIEVMDIRPVTSKIPNVEFVQADILSHRSEKRYEIVTSLHVIEHIGLGRYGDAIDPNGHRKAFLKLSELVEVGGNLWVSFPTAESTEVEFNGQRLIGIFEPLVWAEECRLTLQRLIYLDNDEVFKEYPLKDLSSISISKGNLAIYNFKKLN
jgi:hypothetical protein